MKTIKFYPSDRSLINLDGKLLRGYTIDSIPDNITSWFNYKGLTYGPNTVSYTHSPSPRDRQKSRMPSSA